MAIIFPIGLAKLVMFKSSEIFLNKISFRLEMYDHRPKIKMCVVLSKFWILDTIELYPANNRFPKNKTSINVQTTMTIVTNYMNYWCTLKYIHYNQYIRACTRYISAVVFSCGIYRYGTKTNHFWFATFRCQSNSKILYSIALCTFWRKKWVHCHFIQWN